MIVVTGATGNVGGEIVRALACAGQRVCALVRRGREPPLPAGAEAAPGDLNRPDTLGRTPRTFRQWASEHADRFR